MTLCDVIGPDSFMVKRASDRRCRWLVQDPLIRDSLAAPSLPILGGTPSLCSVFSVTPRVRRLMERAGVILPDDVRTFRDGADHRALLARLHEEWPGSFCVQQVHPPDEIRADRYLVPPDVLSWLNDKANLAALADEANIPLRRIEPASWLFGDAAARDLPFVAKVVTDESTGGGHAVAVCDDEAGVNEARTRFHDARTLVIEERLTIERSFCLNFAVDRSGAVTYLGAAEEVVAPNGRHLGNWLDDRGLPPASIAICAEAMRRAAARGYVGFAGADVAITRDGRAVVLDLNLRFNASTVPLLVLDSVRARNPRPVIRARRWLLPGTLEELEPQLERAIDAGEFVPLSIYDAPDRAFVSGLFLGDTREEVERR
jgi:hypothetical protein